MHERGAGKPEVDEQYDAAWAVEKEIRFRILELRSSSPLFCV